MTVTTIKSERGVIRLDQNTPSLTINDSASPLAKDIHSKAIVVDGHIDTLLELVNGRVFGLGEENTVTHVDFPRLQKGGVNVQFFAAFIEPAYKPERALKRTLQMISQFHREIEKNSDQIMLVTKYDDISKSTKSGKIAALLSIEGGEALAGDLGVLACLYRLGVRAIGLTWNERNDIADGVGEKFANSGLTSFGIEVVKEMNHLGMMIDVSHINEHGFWDVLEHTTKPIIASHSNAFTQCAHVRNLKDDQIVALARNGGVMGMNFAPPFIDRERATIGRLVDHIDHIVQLVGVDYVGLGSDFDGIPATPEGLDDVTCLPAITQALLDRRYSEPDIHKILGGNFLRVMKETI
jgi:membrane dipeptidase